MSGRTIDYYLSLKWSFVGPKAQTDEHGNSWFEVRIRELPDFMLATETFNQAVWELRPALRAFIESYICRGEEPPLPDDRSLAVMKLVARSKQTINLIRPAILNQATATA